MKRVLIVSPRFPPRNAPDHHRVRASLPHYEAFGWKPTVLCVSSATSDGVDDPLLADSLPPQVEVVRVDAWREAASRRLGFGHLDWRCTWPLYRAGTRLLEQRRFDLVFFSTTAFLTFTLGPSWKRRFGCKVVYDIQDPWYTDEPVYDRSNVPGSWWKYRLSRAIARRAERHSMRAADHLLTVSPAYAERLSGRYPWLGPGDFTLVPFGGATDDFTFMRERGVRHRVFERGPGERHWVYAGRVGPDMHGVLNAFFEQLARWRQDEPQAARGLKLHFVGTNYSPEARTYKVVEPLAARHGLADVVREQPVRISYFETLSLYEDSDAVLLFGADSADYTASKLFNCVQSGRPVLALFHASSLAARLAGGMPNAFTATFGASPGEPAFAACVRRGLEWAHRSPQVARTAIEAAISPWSAPELTRIQCAAFDKALAA